MSVSAPRAAPEQPAPTSPVTSAAVDPAASPLNSAVAAHALPQGLTEPLSAQHTVGHLRLRPRSVLSLLMVSVIGLAAFAWPLWAQVEPGTGHSSDAPWLFVLLLPLLLVIVAAEFSEGGMDAKSVALLGVLAAVGCGLRILGAGTAGLEPIFFLLVVVGRVFGPGFGFVFGAITLLTSALITGGVGPWLPFQMLGCAWVAMGAGLLPRARGWAELALLAAYGAVAGLAYGLLLDLWFWPFLVGAASDISYVADEPVSENLSRFLVYHVITALGYDLPRAVLTAVLCVLAGPAVLRILRRATRKAAFEAPIAFTDSGR